VVIKPQSADRRGVKPTLRYRFALIAIASVMSAVAAGAQQQPKLLPGTRPGAFATIQGNALTSTNGHLSDSLVRLRDARYGRIVGYQITDKAGLFAFRSVDPGIYLVEIMGPDQSVLAASELLTVNAGDTVTAVVKLPFQIAPLAGPVATTSKAAVVTTAAAAIGVLSTLVAALQPISP